MRWAACAALLFACTKSAPIVPPDDAGSSPDASDLELDIGGTNRQFYVVRGESTSIPFSLAGSDAARAGTVAAMGLAPGLTADPTAVSGPTSGAVVVHAAADAPPSDLAADLVTPIGGDAKFTIAVVGVDGSLDPSFGSGGILDEPDFTGAFFDIARTTNGAVLVAGGVTSGDSSAVRVLRLLADGSLDASFGAGGAAAVGASEGATGGNIAACADGTFVVTAEDSLGADASYATEYRAFYFDATGALTDDVLLPNASWPSSQACVGGSLVLALDQELVVVDPSRVVHVQPLASAYPTLLAVGASDLYLASDTLAALFSDAPAHYAPDVAFGNQGSIALPSNATALALDGASRILLANGPQTALLRFGAQGALDPSFGQNGIAPVAFGPTTPVAALAIGPTSNDTFAVAASSTGVGLVIARMGASGAPVSTFGLGGVAFAPTVVEPLPERALFDANGRLWVGAKSEQGGAFIARYRVVAP